VLSIAEVIERFWSHAKVDDRRPDGIPTGEADVCKAALRPVLRLFGKTLTVPVRGLGSNDGWDADLQQCRHIQYDDAVTIHPRAHRTGLDQDSEEGRRFGGRRLMIDTRRAKGQ
jgi:hypothetical protein